MWALPLILIDQALKALCSGGALNSENPAYRGVIIIISMLTIVLLKNRLVLTNKSRWLEFVIAGGVSNLIDIIRVGGVIDNINIFRLYFNLADVFISMGICLMIYEIWNQKKSLK